MSHVIQMDNVQVRDNLIMEEAPLRIDDWEVKHFRGKEIVLVKFVWGRKHDVGAGESDGMVLFFQVIFEGKNSISGREL